MSDTITVFFQLTQCQAMLIASGKYQEGPLNNYRRMIVVYFDRAHQRKWIF